MNRIESYQRRTVFLRGFLQGREWFKVLEAMEFAKSIHIGTRKDGVTPEFEHQLSQALYTITIMKDLMYPQETIIVNFLHDCMEDYNISHAQIKELFGSMVADSVQRISKVINGVKIDNEVYYREMEKDPITVIAKPTDRKHNLSTMKGVFTLEKQEAQIEETKRYVLPLLKSGRRRFPSQALACENLKSAIEEQIELYEVMHTLIKGQSK